MWSRNYIQPPLGLCNLPLSSVWSDGHFLYYKYWRKEIGFKGYTPKSQHFSFIAPAMQLPRALKNQGFTPSLQFYNCGALEKLLKSSEPQCRIQNFRASSPKVPCLTHTPCTPTSSGHWIFSRIDPNQLILSSSKGVSFGGLSLNKGDLEPHFYSSFLSFRTLLEYLGIRWVRWGTEI